MGDRRVRPTWLVLLVLAANGSAAASVAVTWAGKPSLVLTWSTLALVVAVTLVAVSVVLSLWSRLR
jgi:hypothetical protein